jgi:hypothetical protein
VTAGLTTAAPPSDWVAAPLTGDPELHGLLAAADRTLRRLGDARI